LHRTQVEQKCERVVSVSANRDGLVPKKLKRTVFLFDVDNTLLDNDRFIADLKRHLKEECGHRRAMEYWAFLEEIQEELGYDDYLGALQRYHNAHAHDPHVLEVSRFIIDYPFETRLFPHANEVVRRFKKWGKVVIVSDGDVVFQPRKIELAGLYHAVDGHVLIYTHKEQEINDVEERYPADHYVVIDDRPDILATFKKRWRSNATTVLIQGGSSAKKHDPKYLEADVRMTCIGDLLQCDIVEHIPRANRQRSQRR
jgi:FMN phosphatase YigB (HAD superfamily)